MYTALIVDDEAIIRRGLKLMLPWEALGFGSVLEVADARRALEIASNTPLSLVITDICMPGIDGLELTQRLLAMQPQLSIVVLTGYDRFEYAQKCCELGVRRLILKPMDEVELTRVLGLEMERLRTFESGETHAHAIERRRRALLSERTIREQLLRRIAQLEYGPGDEEDARRFLRLDPDQGGTAVALQPLPDSMSEWSAHKALLLASIQDCISQAMREQNHGWCFCGEEGDVLLLYGPQADAPTLAEEMRQLVEAEYGLSIRIGVSAPVPSLAGFGAAFAQARASAAMGAENCVNNAAADRPFGVSSYVVQAALRVIREQYREDISVTALAEELHISPNYFSRVFKRAVGMGCNEYITNTRIRAAKERLANTDMRCYEIAEAVGYHDTNYFSLAFKKNTGMSPEQYRISVHRGGRRISDFD